jgi:hypothetical protein
MGKQITAVAFAFVLLLSLAYVPIGAAADGHPAPQLKFMETTEGQGLCIECFPGSAPFFNAADLETIAATISLDKRKPLDRLQIDRDCDKKTGINGIGQIKTKAGQGTAFCIEDSYILTSAHNLAKKGATIHYGQDGETPDRVTFKVGQTAANSNDKFAYTVAGTVVTASYDIVPNNLTGVLDLAVIKLDKPVCKKVGVMNVKLFKDWDEMRVQTKDRLYSTGFPAFRDTKYLLGQKVEVDYDIHAITGAGSSGVSGGPAIWLKGRCEFFAVSTNKSVDKADGLTSNQNFSFNPDRTYVENFTDEDTGDWLERIFSAFP